MRILMLMTALILSGCAYSTKPIFTEQDNVFDDSFSGVWETKQDSILGYNKCEVTRWGPDAKSYRVILFGLSGAKRDTFQLYLSQINGTKFLTAKFENHSSEKPGSEQARTSFEDIPAVYLTFAVDQLEGRQLTARLLSKDWLSRQFEKNPDLLKHEWHTPKGAKQKYFLLLNASTSELRSFVLSKIDKREVWDPVTFHKIR